MKQFERIYVVQYVHTYIIYKYKIYKNINIYIYSLYLSSICLSRLFVVNILVENINNFGVLGELSVAGSILFVNTKLFFKYVVILYLLLNQYSSWIKNPFRTTSEHNHVYIIRDSAHNFLFSYIFVTFRGVTK